MRLLLVLCALAALAAEPATAQLRAPVEGATTASLGQPVSWKGTLTGSTLWREGSTAGAEAGVGILRDLLNPNLGLFAAHAEMYVARRAGDFDGGMRARVLSPFARVGVGADYGFHDGRASLLLSAFHPLRRGGVFGDGSIARADYVPARRSLTVGLEKPIRRRVQMGGSRPRHDRAELPRPTLPHTPLVRPAVQASLATAADAAHRTRRSLLPLPPYFDDGVDFDAQVERYHDALDTAFGLAAAPVGSALAGSAGVGDGEQHDLAAGERARTNGADLAAQARAILLRDVLLPYNRLLGQVRKHDSVLGFGETARGNFIRWLHLESGVPDDRRADVLGVFDALIGIVEAGRAAARAEWQDSRFVWLPLQWALRPSQHDTQAELDAIVQLAVGTDFTDGNFVSWVVNEQFQYQLSRTIHDTRDYHVLWTHDFRGTDDNGDIDEMSYRHVLRSYLAAMTERVREYDRTGTFPVYIILLDQWFYEINHGRLWLTLLEDPIGFELELPPGRRAWQNSIAAAQDELRRAIAGSRLLQEQRRQFGDAWLRNLVKVHVNITNPADPTFWSTRVIRGLPLPDNMMRDHRKIVFRDLTEEDPYRGEALFTGAGIGEHYSNLSWEERSLLVQGPAVLGLKQAARELLLNQAIEPADIPYPLQPRTRPADYDERVRAMQLTARSSRALTVHNAVGFGDKNVNVAKAVLYTLMPAGSVLKIPDSLWNSEFWAAALTGCALRGGRVLVIAPAKPNAPVDKLGTLGRSHAVLTRMLDAQRQLDAPIARAGGMLRVGLYAPALEVTDIPAKVMAVHTTFGREPWLRELFGFPQSVFDGLEELAEQLRQLPARSVSLPEFEYDPTPKLHLKANFFASREAWTLMTRPEWSDASYSYMQMRLAQIQERTAAIARFDSISDPFPDVGTAMVEDWLAGLDEETRENVAFFLLVGSHNQNSRSMVIDAEVGFLLSGWPSIIPYIDLIVIMGQTEWLDDTAELDRLLPPERGWLGRIARWIRLAM